MDKYNRRLLFLLVLLGASLIFGLDQYQQSRRERDILIGCQMQDRKALLTKASIWGNEYNCYRPAREIINIQNKARLI